MKNNILINFFILILSSCTIKINDYKQNKQEKIEIIKKLGVQRNNLFNPSNTYIDKIESELCDEYISDKDFSFIIKVISKIDESFFILIELMIQDEELKNLFYWNLIEPYLKCKLNYFDAEQLLKSFKKYCYENDNLTFKKAIDYLNNLKKQFII